MTTAFICLLCFVAGWISRKYWVRHRQNLTHRAAIELAQRVKRDRRRGELCHYALPR